MEKLASDIDIFMANFVEGSSKVLGCNHDNHSESHPSSQTQGGLSGSHPEFDAEMTRRENQLIQDSESCAGFVPEVTNKQQEKEKLDILIVLTLCRCYLTLGPGGRVGQEYDQVHDNRCNPIVGQLATLWPF
ncbi:conserved hypothetical protein [Ricinus communis]|uniref:Uncharacterized protein n=1 Tax=Ricinus communis TaxID=3988 RepID=B9SMK1_RICCO|nr:conserved hypothetical protein [Ricinus communis]